MTIELSSGEGKTFVGIVWTEERRKEFHELILRSRAAKIQKKNETPIANSEP